MTSDQAHGTNSPPAQKAEHQSPDQTTPSEWTEQSTFDQFALSTLESYLTHNLDPTTTARALTTPINSLLDSPNRTAYHNTSHLPSEESIWTSILTLTRRVPFSSPTIPHLVSLLAALKTMPAPHQNIIPAPSAWEGTKFLWSDLPLFGMEVRENWNRVIVDEEEKAKEEGKEDKDKWTCTPDAWTSMNALLAHLTVARVADFKRYAIWALRDALEEKPTTTTTQAGSWNHLVPAAAVWVLVAGEVMYREWIGLEEPRDRGGELWDGVGFTRGRWGFWKERFKVVEVGLREGEEEVMEETGVLARRAVEKMEEVEGG
ncbi:MAG: hypothetical protein Q9178_001889 [Gyalolechia marmorata]